MNTAGATGATSASSRKTLWFMKHTHQKNSDIEQLADWLDTRFKGPFGFRFGMDGIIGLIPGVGDLVTNMLSGYIIGYAALKGYPKSLVLRMLINLGIENIVGVLPLIGNVFDFFWKSNSKNLQLIQSYHSSPQKVRSQSMVVNVLFFLLIVGFFLGIMALSLWLLIEFIQLLSALI